MRNIAKTARPDSGEAMSSRGFAGIALVLSAATSASDPSDIDLSHIAPNKQLNLRSERIAETISQVTERMQEVQGLL